MVKKKHFVFTRFSVGVFDHPTVDPLPWILNRIELFVRFTLPSMKQQTCKDFTWVLTVDARTPYDLMQLLRATVENAGIAVQILEINPILRWHAASAFQKELPSIKRYVQHSLEDAKYIITTRIDNDDCFHKGAIEQIQAEARTEDGPCLINLLHGYRVDIENGDAVPHPYGSNPFMSLVEHVGPELKTIWTGTHSDVGNRAGRDLGRLIQVDTGRWWAQICHGANLVNRPHKSTELSEQWDDIKDRFI